MRATILAATAFAFAGTLAWGGCDRPPIDRSAGPGGSDLGGNPYADGTEAGAQPGGICGDAPPLDVRARTTDPRVASVLSGLSLAEKVDQMAGPELTPDMFITADNERVGVRGFRFRDGPRGVRLESGTATCFPVAVARAAAWDLDLEYRVGGAIGAETRGLGHNCLLAPTVNVLRHPGWGRAQEAYGEDPWLTGMVGIASTRGIQTRVPACVKHFAANNIEDTRMTNNAVIDEQTLREVYARHFEMIVKEADAACVMAAYNKVNGQYCCENPPLLRDLLKGEWGFDGFVVSDWFAAKSTVESALGGLDVEMPFRANYSGLQLAVSGGQVPQEVIDEAVERILRIKFKFGFALLNEPYVGDPAVVESPAHTSLAREAARKGMVLLKNDGGALPIDAAKDKRIAVVGKWATQARLGDAGSSNVTPGYAVAPYLGIRTRAGSGAQVTTSQDASAAAGADVAVVVVALTQQDEGEAWNGGGDRDSLDLSPDQEQLVRDTAAVAARTVVVIEAGGPITMERWIGDADAIVMAWYPGMEGGRALADVLFGDFDFSGRLVQTWPKRWEDEPAFGNHQAETEMDYWHGYRHFDKTGVEPLFPFGFGLSYSTFSHSNLRIPCGTITPGGLLRVTADVKNTGARAGSEVVQAYVSTPDTTRRRFVKELKGFARVTLSPDETRTVEIPIRIPDLATWDTGTKSWLVEPIRHEVRVGPNARDLPLSGSFVVGPAGKEVAE
ncbi:MAG: glycoside hydrolase family 3 C-terminal domain-containing protein [Deltaproteobacteria bacterium]|nr:glycoside hydrolase family 3 C-terminal domain-containing protein [Deltaproteobacteria bacterium]